MAGLFVYIPQDCNLCGYFIQPCDVEASEISISLFPHFVVYSLAKYLLILLLHRRSCRPADKPSRKLSITPTKSRRSRCDNLKIIFLLKLMNLKTKATIAYSNSTAAYRLLRHRLPRPLTRKAEVKLG